MKNRTIGILQIRVSHHVSIDTGLWADNNDRMSMSHGRPALQARALQIFGMCSTCRHIYCQLWESVKICWYVQYILTHTLLTLGISHVDFLAGFPKGTPRLRHSKTPVASEVLNISVIWSNSNEGGRTYASTNINSKFFLPIKDLKTRMARELMDCPSLSGSHSRLESCL